jgi:hypothetical protein
MVVKAREDLDPKTRPANLILVEQSGTKHEISEPSAGDGILEAENAMRSCGRPLREIKLVSRHTALARWKADEQGWRRVA